MSRHSPSSPHPARRVLAAVLLLAALAVAATPFLYRLSHDRFPPTAGNVVLWVPAEGPACQERAEDIADLPVFGVGVEPPDACPGAAGTGTAWIWAIGVDIVLVVGAFAARGERRGDGRPPPAGMA